MEQERLENMFESVISDWKYHKWNNSFGKNDDDVL